MKITIKNLRGHNGIYEWFGPTLLVGRNGAGKSTVMDAGSLALVGRCLDGSCVDLEGMQLFNGKWQVGMEAGDWRVVRRCDGARLFCESTLADGTSAAHEAALAARLKPRVLSVRCDDIVALGGRALFDLAVRWGGQGNAEGNWRHMIAEAAGLPEAVVAQDVPAPGPDAGMEWFIGVRQRLSTAAEEVRRARRALPKATPSASVADLEAEVARLEAMLARPNADDEIDAVLAEYAEAQDAVTAASAKLALLEASAPREPVAPSEPPPTRVPDVEALVAAVAEAEAAVAQARAAVAHVADAISGERCPTCGRPFAAADIALAAQRKSEAAATLAEAEMRLEAYRAALARAKAAKDLAEQWQAYESERQRYEANRAKHEAATAEAVRARDEARARLGALLQRAEAARAERQAREAEYRRTLDSLRATQAALAEAREAEARSRERTRLEGRAEILRRLDAAVAVVADSVARGVYHALVNTIGALLAPLGTLTVADGRLWIARNGGRIDPRELSAGEAALYALAIGGAVAARHDGLAVLLVDNLEVVHESRAEDLRRICAWLRDQKVWALLASSRPIPGIDEAVAVINMDAAEKRATGTLL